MSIADNGYTDVISVTAVADPGDKLFVVYGADTYVTDLPAGDTGTLQFQILLGGSSATGSAYLAEVDHSLNTECRRVNLNDLLACTSGTGLTVTVRAYFTGTGGTPTGWVKNQSIQVITFKGMNSMFRFNR